MQIAFSCADLIGTNKYELSKIVFVGVGARV
jgi:hypothetical protein